MFYLALLFCLHGSDTACKPLLYPDLQPMPMMACAMAGQTAAAKMLASEPGLRGYELRRAICESESSPRYRRA